MELDLNFDYGHSLEIDLINYAHFDEKYKKILITGGLGFIGSALIYRLLKNTKAKIFNIDKLIHKSNFLSIRFKQLWFHKIISSSK